MATFNLGSQLTLDIFLYRNSLAFGNYLDSASRVSLVTFHWLSLTFNLIGLLFTLVGNRNYMKVTSPNMYYTHVHVFSINIIGDELLLNSGAKFQINE